MVKCKYKNIFINSKRYISVYILNDNAETEMLKDAPGTCNKTFTEGKHIINKLSKG